MPDYPATDNPLKPVCDQWLLKVRAAQEKKDDEFGKYAREAMQFFDGAHDFMWDRKYANAGSGVGGFLGEDAILPTFRMSVNRVFEAVAIFGPVLYHRNPNVMVTPRTPPQIGPEALGITDPNDMQKMQVYQILQQREQIRTANRQTQAGLMEHVLNWLQYESDKKTEARLAVNEAIIKGASLLWTEMHQPAGSSLKYPKSFFSTIDDLVVDPDAERWEDVKWIARYCCHPLWQVEREYGLKEGSLKGHYQSKEMQGNTYGNAKEKESRKYEKSFDLLGYWQVYSKAGFGDRLQKKSDQSPYSQVNLDMFGDYCYIVVADGIPYPLNMPPEAMRDETFDQLYERAHWPIPFYTDGGWPFSFLSFWDKPNSIWPVSLFKPVIGELRFVNWCMSFLADRVAATSITYVGVMKAAAEDIKEQLNKQGGPLKLIEISDITGRRIEEIVSFIQAPNFTIDIWNMVSQVLEMIDKRTGLTELAYGLSGQQMRSATEASVRNENISVRPDDMANQTEDFISQSAVKEMQAARWKLTGDDVRPILGELGAYVWDTQILTEDVDSVVRDFDHRIEAGSARKPNKSTRIRQLNEFGQVALPTIQQFAVNGVVQPWNAFIQDMGKALDLDATPYLINLPQNEQQGPSPEEIEAQVEQQKAQAEIQLKQADLAIKQAELQMLQQKHQMELAHDHQQFEQEMRQRAAENKQKLEITKEQAAAKKKAQQETARAKTTNGKS